MADNILADQADSAFATLLRPIVKTALNLAADAFIPVFEARNSNTKILFNVTVESDAGDEETFRSGNHWVTTDITIKYPVSKRPNQTIGPEDNVKTLLTAINENLIAAGDLEAQLSAAIADFHVFDTSIERHGTTREYADSTWTDKIHLRYLACPVALS